MNTARELTNRLAALLRSERAAMAEFLLALADFDMGKRWRELGYTSLFTYLHRELGLSLGAAQHRKTAVELMHEFPEIVEPLRDGRLCLSVVCEVQKVLTAENRQQVLPRFFGLSRRDAEALVAELRPAEIVPMRTVVTSLRLPTPSVAAGCGMSTPEGVIHPGEAPVRVPEPVPLPAASPPRDQVVPLTADLRRLNITVSKQFVEKLASARSALSHSRPGATDAEILEVALDLLLARDASKKKALVEKPRPPKSTPSSNPRYVPADVRRAVWTRDGGRCQWRMADGSICGSTYRCEIGHVDPVARGGPSTIENCRVECRPHNLEAARRVFGDAWMDRYTRRNGNQARPVRGSG